VASHSRRRYRLLPSNPALPSPDPALFIVHYSKAHGRDTIPAASIPIHPQIAQQINQRRAIQAQGQLARKDFMLHDRANWPQINAPQGVGRGQIGAPGHRRGTSLGNETTLEEEEDVSRGDILDFMTPRDISRMRYEQHHEWMEEVLESPYNIYQIFSGDLGLGRKGELEELTKDFFDAPTVAPRDSSGNAEPAHVGKIDKDKADDFKKRASQKLADMQAEIDKMKEQHARRMAKLQRTTILNSAERKLRAAPTATSGRSLSSASLPEELDVDVLGEIAQEVETKMGKKIERVANVSLVSKGGLQERHTERTFSASSATRPVMSPVKTTASPAVSQSAFPQQTPNSVPQQQAQAEPQPEPEPKPESNSGSEEAAVGEQPQEAQLDSEEKTPADNGGADDTDLPPLDDMGMDVDMDSLINEPEDENPTPAANDWVMVDDQADQTTGDSEEIDTAETAQPENGLEETKGAEVSAPQQAQASGQENVSEQPPNEPPLDDDFGVGDEFDNVDVDTAGDALASYEEGNDDDLDLDAMDDSAFGDAFHQDEDTDIS
jgi:Fungal domain of unknown function (DUF1750)